MHSSATPSRIVAALTLAVLAALPASARASTARASTAQAAPDSRDLTTLVNSQAGSLGPGFTVTDAQLPFGMLTMGPDTNYVHEFDPLNYIGYAYNDQQIHGFSLTHFSGAGIKIGGELPFMPTTGAVVTDPLQYASTYDHATEVSQPGYYAVTLGQSQVKVELAADLRSGIQRYTFPATVQANVLLNGSLSQTSPVADGSGRSGGTHLTDLHVVGDRMLQGSTEEPSKGGYTEFFSAVFDRPFTSFGGWSGSAVSAGARDSHGTENGAYATFDTTTNPVVNMRVGISYVSAAAALSNLDAEIPTGRTLEQVRTAAHDAWNARLHDIEVSGGTSLQQRSFYSMLYRALGMPNLFDDVDGRYLGFDDAVHRLPSGQHHYSNLSVWDIYRTQSPLLALIEPVVEHDVVTSLLDDYDQSGQLPKWVDAHREYGIMGGDSSTALVADAVARGLLHGDEVQRAYAALRDQATRVPPAGPSREHLGDGYLSRGWIGIDTAGTRGTADTLEYGVDDGALVGLAARVGTAADAADFQKRAGNWRNLLYPGTGPTDPNASFIRPRNSNGTWADPDVQNGVTVPWTPLDSAGYQEATGWQASFTEPQDVLGLAQAFGGVAATQSRLDTFFSEALADTPYGTPTTDTAGLGVVYYGNQYAPGNETDLVVPWYYDYLQQPWKTSKVVRQVMSVFSGDNNSMPGNDDAGSMSSWYVSAALGLYGITPGVPAFALNSPTFPSAVVHLGSPDRFFTIDAPASSVAAKYISAATLGGQSLDRSYVTQCELTAGSTLHEDLVATEDHTWATGADAAPPSLSDPVAKGPVSGCLDSNVSATPTPVVPETPLALLLPLVAAATFLLHRSRTRLRGMRP